MIKGKISKFWKNKIYTSLVALVVLSGATFFYISNVRADPVTYYFNNAVDQNPAEQGNYWYDAGFTDPAMELPDFNVDIVYIAGVFNGDARFNGSATNTGEVTGNATFFESSANRAQIDGNAEFYGDSFNGSMVVGNAAFYDNSQNGDPLSAGDDTIGADASFFNNAVNTGSIVGNAFFHDASVNEGGNISLDATFYNDFSENTGKKGQNGVGGIQKRYYDEPTTTVRDFTALAPWTVIADGVEVDVTGAIFDGTTTFQSVNGGTFVGAPLSGLTFYFNNAVNTDPAEPGNYWSDADCTIPANAVPDFQVDEVFIGACSNWTEQVIFNGDATFNLSAMNKGTVTGNAIFNNNSLNTFSGIANSGQGIIQGNAVFNDNAANESVLEGDAQFFDNTQNSSGGGVGAGTVGGNAEFNDTSVNGSNIIGNGVFNDSTQNGGTIGGDATFNDSSLLSGGGVDGDATFNGDLSDIPGHGGSVSGTRTRRYSQDITTTRDFTGIGAPWTVLADGAVVNISDAIIDSGTIFQTLNGGSFLATAPTILSSIIRGKTLTLTYNKTLDGASVPATSDYHLTRNGIDESISNVNVTGATVVLTIGPGSKAVTNDTFVLDYTSGATPVQSLVGADVANLVDRSVTVSLTFIVGTAPTESIAAGNKVYILNSNNVAVLDPATDSVASTININVGSKAVALGNKLYITRSTSSPGLVSVIDMLTDTVTTNINTVNSPNNAILVGTRLYVLPSSSSSITVIDTNTDTVVNTIAVGATPAFPVLVGHKLYVTNQSNGTVKVIDTLTETVSTTITVGAQARAAALVGTKLYVSRTNNISVIDTVTDTVSATIPTSLAASGNALAIGTKVYFSNGAANTVTVVNSLNDSVAATVPVGTTPGQFAVSGTKLFVLNVSTNNVSVIDTTSDTVLATMAASNSPRSAVVLGEDLYVTNPGNGGVTVIHIPTITGQLPNLVSFTSSTSNGRYSAGETVNITAVFGRTLADGSVMTASLNSGGAVVLYVVSGNTLSGTYTIGAGESTPDLSVTAITYASVTDTEAHTQTSYALSSSVDTVNTNSIPVLRNLGDVKNIAVGSFGSAATGQSPQGISPLVTVGGTEYFYVSNKNDNTVSVIRKNDGVIAATIPVGVEPTGITAAVIGGVSNVYVANNGSNTVSVINATTNTVSATITVGNRPSHFEFVEEKLFVSNSTSSTVSVINTGNNTVTSTIAVGVSPRGLKALGTNLYVANYGDRTRGNANYISVINTLTNTVSDAIILPKGNAGAYGLAIYGQKLYVTNYLLNEVWVIDTVTKTLNATISVSGGPRDITVANNTIYVAAFDAGTIWVIDPVQNIETEIIVAGHSPLGFSVSGNFLYFARAKDNLISLVNLSNNTLSSVLLETTTSSGGGMIINNQTPNSETNNPSESETPGGTITPEPTPAQGSIDTKLTNRLKGRLLLAVQDHGKIWYLDPITGQRFQVTLDTAIQVFRRLSLGISNSNLARIFVADSPLRFSVLGNRLKGRLLLQVENRGLIWYVDQNGQRHAVTPKNVIDIFRKLALGITNENLDKIKTGDLN